MVATIGDPPYTTRGKKQRISVFSRVRPLLEHLGEGKILDSTEHTNNDYSHFGSSSSSSSAMYGGGGGVSSSNSNASSSYGSSVGSSHHQQRRVIGKSCVRCVGDTEVVVRGAHQQQLHHSSSSVPHDSHIDQHHGHAAVRPRLSTGTASKSPLLTRGTPATLVAPRSTAARHASPPGRAQPPLPTTTTSNSSSNIGEMSFQFNGVFDPHCTQQDIYEDTMLELLDRALRPDTTSSSCLPPASSGDHSPSSPSSSSVHVSLLCYGPTGSGKTYSMVGAWDPARDPTMTMGILPRTALQILSQIDAHRSKVEKRRLQQPSPLLSSDSTAVRTTPAASSQGPAVPVGLTLFAVELYLDELRDLLLLAHQGTNSATAARRANSPSLGRSNTPPRLGTSSSSTTAGGVVGRQQSRASSSPLVLRHGVSFPSGRLFKEGAQSIPASSTPASFFHSTAAASAPTMTAPSSSAQAYGASTIPIKDYTSFEELCDTLCGAEITSLSSLQDIYHSISNTRMTSSTASNDKSSRSHAFFILRISFDSSSPRGGSTPVSPSFVVLADLAGSERLKQSQAEGVGVLEAQSINKSLSALCTVVTSLHQNSKHVPFRDSRLTRLLRPCLENGWVTALVHVPPADGQRDEAIQTLKFAERMSQTVLPSVSTAVTATQQHRSAAGGDLQLRDASSYFDDPKKQEALEFQNERAQLQMDVLSAELRIANAAYGHLPRRLATLPLASMATLYPEWHTAWQRVRHALETDTAEGTSVARSVVDRTKREIMLKVNALKSALEKESQEVENLRESLAQLENDDDGRFPGGDEALSSHSIYKKLQREHSAAIKIKLLVQHRLLVLSENEAHLKRQAHHIKTDLLDEAGSWHSLHRNVDDASESLQRETRNGLVMQGLFADQYDVLRDILAYLEGKRSRRRIERLCVEAEALGYGQLVLSNQASQQEGRILTRNNGKSSLSSSYRKQQHPADDALFLDDEDDDVCSIDWEEYHDEVGGTSDDKRNDNNNTATNNNTQQHQKKQQDVNSIFQRPLAPVEISGGVVVKRSIFVERSLFSSPSQSSSSKRDNNNGGASQSIFKSPSSQANNKTASSSRSSANEPTREDLPTTQQRHHHHAISSISGDGSAAASIFVTLRQRHLVPWYATTRVVPAPKHWAPRPLLLHGWYDAPLPTRTAHDYDDEGERVAADKEGGVSSSGGRRGTHDRQLCSYPSLTGHYHNPEARRYVALRALSSRSLHTAHLVVSSTQRYDPRSINSSSSSSSALVALSIIKHEGNTRRLQLMSVNGTMQEQSFPCTTNNESVTSGVDPLLIGWVIIPPRRLSGSAAESFSATTSSMCFIVVDEMVPSRHLLALHVVVARARRGGGFNEATGVASPKTRWVLLEFSNATILELVFFAVTPLLRFSVDESQTSSSGLLLRRLSAVVTETSTMLPGVVPVVTLADYYRRLDSTGGKLTTEVLSSSSCTTTIIPQLSPTSSLTIVIEDVSARIRDTLTLVYTFTPTTTAEYVLLSRILSSVVGKPEEASKSISLGDVRTLCNPHGFNIFALALLLRHMASQHHGAHLSGQ
ncbi:kinesin, putative [Bodo saltans]|uniref:Kinesin, putative n=1 Tax=Bodo saltans TaxID=75058 RepID=A0A0S4IPB2_BODSA|nr:kinesin, putative [Bodo saltans]|eukprot:CUF04801.1 kinesin, putative [Bodo saltans]